MKIAKKTMQEEETVVLMASKEGSSCGAYDVARWGKCPDRFVFRIYTKDEGGVLEDDRGEAHGGREEEGQLPSLPKKGEPRAAEKRDVKGKLEARPPPTEEVLGMDMAVQTEEEPRGKDAAAQT